MCLTYELHVLYVNTCEFHVYWSVHLFCLTHDHVCFSYAHTSVTYAGNAIRNFTFALHTATTRSERHVSVYLHALIVQMFCRIYCRTLCKILFPYIARSHTFSKDECRSCDPQGISKKIAVLQPQARTHTHRRSLYTSRPARISPPYPVSLFLVLF